MVTFRHTALIGCLVLLSATSGKAQGHKGAVEIGVKAGPFILLATGGRELLGVLALSLDPEVDFFLSDKVEIGASGFFYRTFDGDQPLAFGGAYAHVNVHLNPRSTVSPYAGGRVGAFTSNGDALFGLGGQLGLQWFVAPHFSIDGQLVVTVYPGSSGVGLLSSLGFGLSYFTH